MNDPGRMPSDAIARLRRLAPDAGLWRGLEELADTAEFRAFVEAEFPALAGSFRADRRRFLKLAGASLALAGLAGCTRPPPEKIVPYARSPQEIVPAEALYYATALPFDGYAQGVLVKSVMGRPTKVEGNPRHPASLGGTGIHAQAAVLDLWDPGRSRGAAHRGEPATWDGFLQALAAQRARWQQSDGRGLHLLTGRVTSPTLTAQIAALLDELPQARWHVHEPAASDNATTGAQIAFGAPRRAVLRLEAARRIVALDADFLGPGPLQPR
ncbi:MAG TPA: TAT-variant-translocated molybdopterin oxidoreductase, partial [Pelomicrobium sp.]|nr:TAT-variant-translocated molybdopterin oxidoreductase [Pelomicrobium sp.]